MKKRSLKPLASAYIALASAANPKRREEIAGEVVRLLAERHELSRSRELMRQIDVVWKRKNGVSSVTVTSAYPLSKEIRTRLEKTVSGAAIEERTDERLIGGAVLRVDDRLIDGSVAGFLNALKETLHSV